MKIVSKKDLCFKLDKDLTLDDGDSRSFSGVAYSGQMIKGHPFWGDLIFDVSTMQFKESINILFNHDPNRIVGKGVLSKGKDLSVNGTFSEYTPDGVMLYGLIKKEGNPMEQSVFIEPDVEELKKGTAVVNGFTIEAPVTIFRNGKIREVSLTPLGADANTSTQAFNLTTVTVKEIKKMTKQEKNFQKFSELLEENPEEAFKFACSCQDKKEGTAAAASGDQATIDALTAENEDLKKQIETLTAELQGLKDAKMNESKLMKARRVKELFSKYKVEVSEDVVDTYLAAPENKFDSLLASVDTNLKQIAGDQKFSDLTKETKIEKPVENLEENEKLKKIQLKASEIRSKNRNLTVPDSYEKARQELGIRE